MTVNPFKGQDPVSRVHAKINRLGVRTSQLERRITGAAAAPNDWVLAGVALGTVAAGPTSVDYDMAGSIVHQTDDGSVYAEGTGAITPISFLQVGSFLVRAKFTLPEGKTGYAMGSAVISGPCTTYDYDVVRFMPLSVPDTGAGTDMGKYGGQILWQQLCVVHDLSAPTGAYLTFENLDGPSLIAGTAELQVFRLT